jgi:hypothetical protein
MRYACSIFWGKSVFNRPTDQQGKCEDDIEMDLREMDFEDWRLEELSSWTFGFLFQGVVLRLQD